MIKKYGFNIFTLIAASLVLSRAIWWMLLAQNQLTIFVVIVASGLLLSEINHLMLVMDKYKKEGVIKCDPLEKSLDE
ncbi:hypothetical protein FZC83_01855 [Rossellomorea marisflavi]|uniref:Uncharacterized protein n=1 Tax=Rossellomorea marisflavi TaxID=189381 RepID=A0A5D4RZE3_9BACI|nr:hypothetical protein [Rossellomorea marisflavi]TYS56340.1 hypothetical protein FZC83_01855 [Rossellomorea marisflavi]